MFTIGIGEILVFVVTLVGAGWTLISLTFKQFEKRLDEKLITLDTAVTEIKRLEIEIIRNDARSAQIYVTKAASEKSLERIFNILERMETSLTVKVSREEVDRLIQQAVRNFK